jgi:hypothetical protein
LDGLNTFYYVYSQALCATMWFSLPLEVRLDIYKRSRFLMTRERLEKKLATRSRPVLQRRCAWWSNYIVSFPITTEKFIHIEYFIKHPNNQEDDILVVDTCDYSQIAVFLHINENDKITLTIGTEYTVRCVQRRPYAQNKLNSNCTTYTQWLKDRRFLI